jgi:hypothetical protein
MSSIRTVIVAATVVAAASVGLVAPASARCTKGFLADLACRLGVIPPDAARAADRLHKGLGNPLDRIGPGHARPMPPHPGMPFPMQHPHMQRPLGNFCMTSFGRFGPGPVNPIGSPCQATGPYGPVFGTVTR